MAFSFSHAPIDVFFFPIMRAPSFSARYRVDFFRPSLSGQGLSSASRYRPKEAGPPAFQKSFLFFCARLGLIPHSHFRLRLNLCDFLFGIFYPWLPRRNCILPFSFFDSLNEPNGFMTPRIVGVPFSAGLPPPNTYGTPNPPFSGELMDTVQLIKHASFLLSPPLLARDGCES